MSVTKAAQMRGALSGLPTTGPVTIHPASAAVWRLLLSATAEAAMPDATTLVGGEFVWIWNDHGSITLTVKDADGNTLGTIAAQAAALVTLYDNSTSAGVWGFTNMTIQVP